MRVAKSFMWIGCLCAAFAAACVTDTSVPPAKSDTTSQTAQQIGGGDDLCASWDACYAFCRRLYQCTDPTRCAYQLTCLTNCDSANYPAPEICPYPE